MGFYLFNCCTSIRFPVCFYFERICRMHWFSVTLTWRSRFKREYPLRCWGSLLDGDCGAVAGAVHRADNIPACILICTGRPDSASTLSFSLSLTQIPLLSICSLLLLLLLFFIIICILSLCRFSSCRTQNTSGHPDSAKLFKMTLNGHLSCRNSIPGVIFRRLRLLNVCSINIAAVARRSPLDIMRPCTSAACLQDV